MTIASMDELEAMAPGSAVRVTSRRIGARIFTRTEDGFEYNGTTVETRWFAGHVAAGEVANFSSGDPDPGDLYHSGSRRYVVTAVEDGTVWIMQFTADGEYRNSLTRPLVDARRLSWVRVLPDQRPDWYPSAFNMGVLTTNHQREAKRYAEQVDEVRAERDRAVLDLTRLRELRAAQIQVVATGVTRLPVEKAAGHVPDKVTVVDVLASWRREFTVTTEPVAGCQCGSLSREDVIGLLGIDGKSEHADFGFQVDCGRH